MNKREIIDAVDFEKGEGLVPTVVQDAGTGKVLMLGYMNKASLEKTFEEKRVCFYSRSRQELWTKGETSGNFLHVADVLIDCDSDTLLVKARPEGPTCHTGAATCFGEESTGNLAFIAQLEGIIRDRKLNPSESSYTSKLFNKGINKIAQKVGEEAVELVIEAKDDDRGKFKNECADLIYHLLVLLEQKEIPLSEVIDVLIQRHQ